MRNGFLRWLPGRNELEEVIQVRWGARAYDGPKRRTKVWRQVWQMTDLAASFVLVWLLAVPPAACTRKIRNRCMNITLATLPWHSDLASAVLWLPVHAMVRKKQRCGRGGLTFPMIEVAKMKEMKMKRQRWAC